MRIMSFNVNGIRSLNRYIASHHKTNFNDYVKDILVADILCLQETRGDVRVLREFHTLKDYVTFTSTNGKNNGRCGASTMVSKKLYCRGMAQSPYSGEGRSLLTDHGGFKILNVYFPFFNEESDRDKSSVLEFYERIGTFIREHDNLIICGDFNAVYAVIDHYQFYNELKRIESRSKAGVGVDEHEASSTSCSIQEGKKARRYACRTELPYEFNSSSALEAYLFEVDQRRWMKSLVDGGNYIDSYRVFHRRSSAYTCWNTILNLRPRNLGTRIDYILIPKGFLHRLKGADISPDVYGSDHCPVHIDIDLEILDDERNVVGKKNNLLGFLKG